MLSRAPGYAAFSTSETIADVEVGSVDYDAEQDSAYVPVLDHRPLSAPAATSFEDDGVAVDRDEAGHVVGYEVHFVRRDGLDQRPSLPQEIVRALRTALPFA